MKNESLNLREGFDSNVSRLRLIVEGDDFLLHGHWNLEIYRESKKINQIDFPNLVPTAAKNSLFDTMFNAATQIAAASWFAGLVNNAGWTTFAAGDTHASHAGWTEFTGYSQATRPLWGQGAAASGAITNASQIVFDITATATIKGLFTASLSTKGSTAAAMLWSEGAYTSTIDVVNGDQIRSTYTVSG